MGKKIISIQPITHAEAEVAIINSISKLYDKLRSKSKGPTFALTYLGTWKTLVTNCGFDDADAKATEANYHQLYQVSSAWVADKLDKASINGYVTLAFGLRLRTPILAKTILGNSYTPQQAAAESRTAGNAVSGQSYGLLTSRAGVEFQQRTIASKHRTDIRPAAHIHDAIYLMIRDNLETVKWVNDNLVECIEWQELPEIQSTDVPLKGNLGVFYPNWSNEIELANRIDYPDLINTCQKGRASYHAK
ncbi:MAG: DNA polymerase [Fusobacteriaceae bacterium]